MRVAIEVIPLACCAVEVGSALAQPVAAPEIEWVFGDGERDLTVLVLAGTVTHANSERVRDRIASARTPKLVAAYGVCAASGGPYWDSSAVLQGWSNADVFVPGCPPPPSSFWAAVTEAVANASR